MSKMETARRRVASEQREPLTSHDEPDRDYSKISHAVSREPALSDSAFRTYVNIKSHYYGNGSCFPGLDRLASYQGVSRRTIQTNIAELKAAGLIVSTRRGLGLTNSYDVPNAREWTPTKLTEWKLASHQRSGKLLHIHGATDFTSDVKHTSHKEETVPKKKQTKEETVSCADKPRSRTRSAKPLLKDTNPQLAADRDACIAHWHTVTGKEPNGGTRATVAGLLGKHAPADITGTIDALWRDPFWHKGNMSWSVIADRIAAFKAGALTANSPKGQPADPGRMGAGMGGQRIATDGGAPFCRCTVRLGGAHWTERCGRTGVVTEEDCRG